jgi:hypothetical protein
MDFIYKLAILIILFIITFTAFIFFPRGKNYFDYEKKCPELELFLDNIEIIKNECINLEFKQWINNNLDNKISANVIYLFNKLSKDVFKIPNTYNLLTQIPELKSCIIFKISPDTYIKNQRDIIELSNNTIRCFIPLKLSTILKNGLIVNDQIKILQNNNIILFDNSKNYSIFNKHKYEPTYILSLDIKRSEKIPLGISTIKKTKKYDELIDNENYFYI